MSNAALRSNRTKMAQDPVSTVRRMSFFTLSRADSVLCRVLKPDWNLSRMEYVCKYEDTCVKTIFSRTFERNGSFEMGL